MQGLDRLSDQMHDLDRQRATWQGAAPRSTSSDLRRETQSLSTALRKPQVRGRWGELHLRRAVELAGLVDRCDFAEQVRLDDGALRPDLVVHLVGGRQRRGRRQGAARRLPRRHRPPTTRPSASVALPRHAAPAAHPHRRPGVQALLALAAGDARSSWCCSCPAESFLAAALDDRRLPDRVRRRAPGRAGHPDHPDRPAAHRRPRLEPRGAGRPGPRDPPARPRPARPARHASTATSTRSAARSTPPSATTTRPSGSLESRVLVAARRFARPVGASTTSSPTPRQVDAAARSVGRRPTGGASPPTASDRGLRVVGVTQAGPSGKRGASPAARSSRSGSRSPSRSWSLDLRAGRPGQPVLRPLLRRALRRPRAGGPAPRLLHRRRAAAAADGRRLRPARRSTRPDVIARPARRRRPGRGVAGSPTTAARCRRLRCSAWRCLADPAPGARSAARQAASKRVGSPAPTRTISG